MSTTFGGDGKTHPDLTVSLASRSTHASSLARMTIDDVKQPAAR